MIRIKGTLKHRCTCGTIYEPESRQETRCHECVDKPVPAPAPAVHGNRDSRDNRIRHILLTGTVEDLLNEPARPNQYDFDGGM